MHSAVKGCFKDRNPKFKETIDMLIALGADSTVKNSIEKTAKQYAMDKLLTVLREVISNDYDYYDFLLGKFESCEECVMKKEKSGEKYWSGFITDFSECNECFQNFKDELQCYHSTW